MNKVAVIDDNLLFRKITKQLLVNIGFKESNIILLENGRIAINYIIENIEDKSLLPNIILLDLNMPKVNGWEFINLLQNLSKKFNYLPKIYIITSSVDTKDIERAKIIKEVKSYIIKPITSKDLIKALKLKTQEK
ncbi:response regulator [Neotamlana nanhaiensis]|uniref:response regulator n=1 Tax=Neotamlana nanhaiensis TaxID=1382798 RepID=UPI0005CBD20E|nr:response regulator [Tamlana nanhaiensis]